MQRKSACIISQLRVGSTGSFMWGLARWTSACIQSPGIWVDREKVIGYPTDFSAMSENYVAMLSERGETLTRALVTRYLLSD